MQRLDSKAFLPNPAEDAFPDTARGIRFRELDQAARNDQEMYRLCSNFHTTEDKEVITEVKQFTNHNDAEDLLDLNTKVKFPFKLFDYLQRNCPCILEHEIFKRALDNLLDSREIYTPDEIAIAAKIKLPHISTEFGVELLVEKYDLPTLDTQHLRHIEKTTSFPPMIARLINAYACESNTYKSKPELINRQLCPTWKGLDAHFDLAYILKKEFKLSASIIFEPIAATAIGRLDIDRDTTGLGIQAALLGEFSIVLRCTAPVHEKRCQQLFDILEVLSQQYKFHYVDVHCNRLGEASKKINRADIAVLVSDKNVATVVFRTASGMEYGLKALARLCLVDSNALLPFHLYALNVRSLEAKDCFSTIAFAEMSKPLRTLAKKSKSYFFKKETLEQKIVRQTVERIVMWLDALSEKKDDKVSMTEDRLKQVMQHFVNNSPYKAILLADAKFDDALRGFKIDFGFPKVVRADATQSKVIKITPKKPSQAGTS